MELMIHMIIPIQIYQANDLMNQKKNPQIKKRIDQFSREKGAWSQRKIKSFLIQIFRRKKKLKIVEKSKKQNKFNKIHLYH